MLYFSVPVMVCKAPAFRYCTIPGGAALTPSRRSHRTRITLGAGLVKPDNPSGIFLVKVRRSAGLGRG
jgi:hypothetical protein